MSDEPIIDFPLATDWPLLAAVSEVMEVENWAHEGRYVAFRGRLKTGPGAALRQLRGRLENSGMLPFLSRERGKDLIRCGTVRRRKDAAPRRWLPPVLFLATVVSTLMVGSLMASTSIRSLISRPWLVWRGAPFSFTLLLILACHEFSHYFTSRKHGVKTSLPYFIPFPNILGTMGAVIVSRSPFPDRKGLFDVGVAGPLASFVLSVGAILLGLSGMSLVRTVPPGPETGLGIYLGNSLLTNALFRLRFETVPPGYSVYLGPVGFAGWVGLFVTALNLLPMGQLDGGHLSYAVFGRRHGLITRATMLALAVFGLLYASPFWIFVAVLIAVIGPRHGPPLDDITPLNPARKLLAAAALLILAACFIPVPIGIG